MSKKKILIVEDDLNLVKALTTRLRINLSWIVRIF